MRMVLVALSVAVAIGSAPVMAANADHPFSNVDKRLDKGGDTGDSRVEELNRRQTDGAQAPGQTPAPTPAPPAASSPVTVPPAPR